MNNNGPKKDPWGTPENRCLSPDFAFPITTMITDNFNRYSSTGFSKFLYNYIIKIIMVIIIIIIIIIQYKNFYN